MSGAAEENIIYDLTRVSNQSVIYPIKSRETSPFELTFDFMSSSSLMLLSVYFGVGVAHWEEVLVQFPLEQTYFLVAFCKTPRSASKTHPAFSSKYTRGRISVEQNDRSVKLALHLSYVIMA
jgi:hypothetical protein